METAKQCQLCDLRTTSLSFLLRHLTIVHSTQPCFYFRCGLNQCQRTFQNIITYKHHVYSAHTKNHTNLHSGQDGSSRDGAVDNDYSEGDERNSQSDFSSDEDSGTQEQCSVQEETG